MRLDGVREGDLRVLPRAVHLIDEPENIRCAAIIGLPAASNCRQREQAAQLDQMGGPGFCFPVWRWNGKAYALNRFEYEGKRCKRP